MSERVRLFTLGELRLVEGDRDLLPGRRKVLALLAYLAAHSPRGIAREELAALFWGEREETRARQSLRQALRELRSTLAERIEISADLVSLPAGAIELDVERFESDLVRGELERAVERWRGDFLPGAEELGTDPFRAWVEAEREQLRRRCADALEQLAAAAEHRGEWGAAIAWLERWAEIAPVSEAANARLILALRLAGRTEDASDVHAAAVARIRRELGCEPSPEFLMLAGVPDPPRRRGDPAAPRSAALFSPDMVGRGAAFQRLADAWSQVRAGSAMVRMVEGEEGIGKTRLCEEFLRWVAAAGGEVLILRARAYAAERGTDGIVLRDLLAGLADAPGLGGAPEAALAAVAEVVPAIRERFPRLPRPTEQPQAFADAVHRVLGDVSAEIPLLLFVDDLPAADDRSRDLLLALARRLPDHCLLLVTANPTAPGYAELVEPLHELPELQRISLGALDAAEVEALLDSMLQLEPEQRRTLARQLHAEAWGNPFYVSALISALADAGHLERDAHGVWRLSLAEDGMLPLPPTVRDAVEARLRHLSPVAREILGAASVLGRALDPALLEAVVEQPATAFCEGVEELIARRLLRLASSPAGHLEFSHDLIRRVTQDLVGPARQQLLQRSLAEVRGQAQPEAPRQISTAAPTRQQADRIRMAGAGPRWRRGAVLALLVLMAAAATGIATLRERAAPVSAGVVAVLPFEYRGGESYQYLGEGLADLLSVKLDGAYDLTSVDPRVLLGSIARGGRQHIAPAQGRALAARFGAGHFVLGSVVESRGTLQVSASLYDSEGEILSTAAARVEDEAGVLGLVDDLARQLLAGRHRGAAASLVQAAAVTTPSLPALKAYLEGERQLRAGRFAEAATAFAGATEADTAFALAYYRLSVALEWAPQDGRLIDRAIEGAARHAHRLPERSRLLVEAATARRQGAMRRADSLYQQVLAVSRDDFEATFQLAESIFHDRPVRGGTVVDARHYWQKVLDLDPGNGFALVHLARIAASQDSLAGFFTRHAAAVEQVPTDDRRGMELELWKALHEGRPLEGGPLAQRLRTSTGYVYVPFPQIVTFSRDPAGSERLLSELQALTVTTWLDEVQRAYLLAARGRWKAADSVLAARPLPRPHVVPHRVLLAATAADLEAGGDPRRLRGQLAPWPPGLDGAEDPRIRPLLLGLLESAANDGRATREQAAELERTQGFPLVHDLALTLRAAALRGSGQRAEALRLLDRVQWQASWDQSFNSPFHSRVHTRWLTAELLRELGDDERALRWYASLGQAGPFEIAFVAPAHLRRAGIHDRRGEREQALEHYRRFLELWQDADPELQPRVRAARERIQRLEEIR